MSLNEWNLYDQKHELQWENVNTCMLINEQRQINLYCFYLNIVFEEPWFLNVDVLGLPFLVRPFTCPAYFFANGFFFSCFILILEFWTTSSAKEKDRTLMYKSKMLCKTS